MQKKLIWMIGFGVVMMARPGLAQLNQVFNRIFTEILDTRFTLSRSPGQHGEHFRDASIIANQKLVPALNSLIASNVSSFPLSSTAAGITFDVSSGMPVSIMESLGPIFAENARTLGEGKVNIGFNATYLSLDKFRGLPTRDIQFTFTHVDFPQTGVLGDNPNESDLVDFDLDLNANASIFALLATIGVTKNLDVGLAIPFVRISLRGNTTATVESFTFARNDSASHHFGDDTRNPVLFTSTNYDESATGLGDIGLRLKYRFFRAAEVEMAALLDLRLPTGDEKDFLGTGKTNARFTWIMSKKIGDFSPHLNLGYERRAGSLDSDEFEFTAGFDQKIASGVSFAAEFLGEFDVNRGEAIKLFPGTTEIIDMPRSSQSRNVRQVDLSNVPDRNYDHTLNGSFGFRIAPSERLLLLGNILVPLNDGGLRSNVVPTLGVSVNF